MFLKELSLKSYQIVIEKVKKVDSIFRKYLEEKLLPLLFQAIIFSKKYDCVVTK